MSAVCPALAAGTDQAGGRPAPGSAGFDVAAKTPFGRDILDLAHREPYLPGRDARTEGLVGRPAADTRQDQGAAKDPGIPCPEFVVHEPPKVTDSHY